MFSFILILLLWVGKNCKHSVGFFSFLMNIMNLVPQERKDFAVILIKININNVELQNRYVDHKTKIIIIIKILPYPSLF